MAEGDAVGLFDSFKEELMGGQHDLDTGGHTFKIILISTSVAPSLSADSTVGDVDPDEYSTGAGYTAGGETIGTQDVTQVNSTAKWDAADTTWSSLGPLSPATPDYAVIYNTTSVPAANPLVCAWTLGTTATNGGDYTISYASTGIITLTS